MRTLWVRMRWLGVGLVLLGGCKSSESQWNPGHVFSKLCKSSDPEVKPPPHVEEYHLPPEAEARFSKPMTFPDGTPRAAKLNRGGGISPLSDPTRFQGTRPGAGGLY